MPALLDMTFFGPDGHLIRSNQITLPDSLDWKDLAEKEVYVRFMGGFPEKTVHALLKSQGQQKLISDFDADSKIPLDLELYRRRQNEHEEHLESRCRELGIDRTRKPRNQ